MRVLRLCVDSQAARWGGKQVQSKSLGNASTALSASRGLGLSACASCRGLSKLLPLMWLDCSIWLWNPSED